VPHCFEMELRLYGGGWDLRIPNYSIVKSLLYDVVAMTPTRELSPCEKLFVVKNVGQEVHPGYLRDVYVACGCFDEAQQAAARPPDRRKLGDAAWLAGDLDRAEEFFSAEPDRAIKLAFFREQWHRVISKFASAGIGRGFSPGKILMTAWETPAKPYLEMLAVAMHRTAPGPEPPVILEILKHSFGMTKRQWARFAQNPVFSREATVAQLKKRCLPKKLKVLPLTADKAMQKGATARHVAEYIKSAESSLERAQLVLEEFGSGGEERYLEEFIALVTGSGVTPISHSFLFAAFGHDSFPKQDLQPSRIVRLLSAHPVMNKRHFGTLLDLRFKHKLAVTAEDILTGLFQALGRWSSPISTRNSESFDVAKLASCREWARIRLNEWLQRGGTQRVNKVAQVWCDGQAQPAPHPFYLGVIGPPDSPRNMKEWDELMSAALEWLERTWNREIGATRWIAENQLYQILRRRLKGTVVQQHARPTWLAPQHLDVYIPELGIAVEYMGRQHFEPLDFFGGADAFRDLVTRDGRKAELCRQHRVDLVRVRYDEDVGLRATEIGDRILRDLAGLAAKGRR